MKVKLEVSYNNKVSCSVIDYNEFSVEDITSRLNKLPNFKPNLVEFRHEDTQDSSFCIMNLKYCNLSRAADQAIVRVTPMFNVMESILKKAS